jgi:dTDP-4-dehydrorhamnose 3,5-epimerase
MGKSIDSRGVLSFVNEVNFKDVKRVYMVENFSTDTVRAFHGHMVENKYVMVVKGSIILVTAEIHTRIVDPTQTKHLEVPTVGTVSDRDFRIVYIPAGNANGFRAIEQGTRVVFFSTSTVEESKNDDFRFPYDYFGKRIWEADNR